MSLPSDITNSSPNAVAHLGTFASTSEKPDNVNIVDKGGKKVSDTTYMVDVPRITDSRVCCSQEGRVDEPEQETAGVLQQVLSSRQLVLMLIL